VSGRIRIKICGITHPDDGEAAVAAGADLIGLNFVPGSPRCLDLKTAEEVANRVAGQVDRVAIFKDAEPEDIERGWFAARSRDGTRIRIIWDEVASDPGWCKLDWIVADPVRSQVANASNMLDVTWEAPDGSIEALDGFVDHYFQEIYLEAESLPVFAKLVRNASPDALDDYVVALESEVHKYISQEPRNYGKAAKRMYNIFRYNGSYAEAAYLRELFDEPTAALYQIHAAIRAIDEASEPDAGITDEMLLAELDRAIVTVVDTIDGEEETEIVRGLLDLRASIADEADQDGSERVEATRQRLLNLVNSFFYEKLTAVPTIASFMNGLS